MNGAIIPHTPIAVDFWNVRETAANNCRLFFLSHAHADHTVGLTSSWKNHKLYCSELTKKIIVHKLGVHHELVIGLPVDQPVVIAMDEVGKENLTVTLIDANHCPGAVLFLFQGYFGNILYTGDFRYHKSLSTHHALQEIVIDKLYLDNTYCEPKCVFPTREDATNKILDIIRKHLDYNIVFGMNTLGKEDLLVKIGLTFQTWIGVHPKRMELLKLLDLPDVFTCDIESTRIRVVMKKEISKINLRVWNDKHPTIAILPTALFEGETNLYKNMENVFVIPLSDHSSFDELVRFVSEIKPKGIVPLVLRHRSAKGDPSNLRVNMNVFSTFLNKEPLSVTTIPATVLQFMGTRSKFCKARKRSKMFSAPKQKRQKCTGVVFSDEEEDATEQTVQSTCAMREAKVTQNGEDSQDSEVLSNLDREISSTLEQINKSDNREFTGISKKKDKDVHVENALRNSLFDQDENESENKKNTETEKIEASPGCQTSKFLSMTDSFLLKTKENEFVTLKSSGENKSLALELLKAFNQGNYEDQYTDGNPVYKRFVGHFCEHLKSVASDKVLEAGYDDANIQHTSCSSPKRDKKKSLCESPQFPHQNKDVTTIVLDEVETDSDEESLSEFNWFL